MPPRQGKMRSALRPGAQPRGGNGAAGADGSTSAPPAVTQRVDAAAEDGEIILRPPPVPHHKLFPNLPPNALEPKVLLPFQHSRGRVPRKIEIERKRRLFESQDVEELCRVAGLPLEDIGARSGRLLPIEIFDDQSFDARTPQEWMELAHAGAAAAGADSHYLPAKAVREDKEQGWRYEYCRVVDWNRDTGMLRVLWGPKTAEQGDESAWVPRIHVMFLAEDPTAYVQRLLRAHELRRKALSWVRYKLYCDSMPTEEMSEVEDGVLDRIVRLGTEIRSLPQNERANIAHQERALVDEFVLEWRRRMNHRMLEDKMGRLLKKDEHSELVHNLDEVTKGLSRDSIVRGPSDEEDREPLAAVVPVPPEARQEFHESCQAFNFSTFFTQPEVVRAQVAVRTVCQEVLMGSLFNLPLERHMSLQEFQSRQHTSIEERSEYLKTEWKDTLKECIIHHIKGVGQGWLNLREKSKEIYEISKLKHFLTTVKYMMEDTLHFLVMASLESFTDFIEDVSNYTVKVKDMYTVDNSWPGSDDPASIEKTPLFTLELVERDGEFSYSTPPTEFAQQILALFDKAIVCTHEVPQLEKHVMSHYFWPEEKGREAAPYCDSVSSHDPRVRKMRERVRIAIEASLAPLEDYKATYHKFTDIIRLDKGEYLKEFQSIFEDPDAKNPTEDLAAEIKKQERKKKEVRKEIPHYMEVGNFFVDCTTFRATMERKHEELKKSVEDLIKEVAKEKSKMIREQFTRINAIIQKPAQTVDALFSTRGYIKKDIPELVYQPPEGLMSKIDEMKTFYSILESFQCQLPDEDFKFKWEAQFWPKKLEMAVDSVTKRLDAEGEKLHDAMVIEQDAFKKELEKIAREVQKFSAQSELGNVASLAAEVKSLQRRINEAREQSGEYNKKQELFGDEVVNYSVIVATNKEFKPYHDLWITTDEWLKSSDTWHKDAFDTLDPEEIKKIVDQTDKVMGQLRKTFKDKPQMKVVDEIRDQVMLFQPMVPLVQSLRNKGMRDRHWEKLAEKLNEKNPGTLPEEHPEEGITTLSDIEQKELVKYADIINTVCEVASKEYQIEASLKDMIGKWKDVNYKIEEYKTTKTYMMKGSEDVQARLDEDINMTQQLMFSPFKGHFEDQINEWEKSLQLISEILEQWLECQRSWLYLQPIFSAEDIQMQLPALSKRFEKVDRTWRKVMHQAAQNPNALEFSTKTTKLLEQFVDANKNLEVVQKGLNDYLGEKRQAYGRFYFLSDEELLEILSQARDPRTMDRHMPKLIEMMFKMDWERPESERSRPPKVEEDTMLGWTSSEGETIPFVDPVLPKGNVEIWLGDVQDAMKEGLHRSLSLSHADYPQRPRKEWVISWCGQIVIAVSQIWWTIDVEEVLDKAGVDGLREYYKKAESQLLDLVDVVQSPLNRMQRINMGALITIEVHAKDTTFQMVESNTSAVTDFDWIKQLRYYYNTQTNRCDIKQVDALFEYGGEYLGNTMRLVVTPLTDRIYLTLTGALALCLGGAPAGPAGTGKTETTKDLAKALSKQCVVFNCQEGLDFRAMGKFFKGLAMTGAWACFDEFNRIDVEVLSVVAQQVSDLQEALKRKQFRIHFEGSEITVDPTLGVFITMNPGYAGRTELPDNLKVLFRPVACMVPDYALIGEIRLFSYGYRSARPLSKKMVQTFQLSSEQLSSQDHYDFGMRAVNTVITAAGLNKRDNPDGNEDLLLLRSLRDSNVPKFLTADIVLFENIILDLFPGAKLPEVDYGALLEGLTLGCKEFGAQPVPEFIKKCIQLYEVTVLRHGLMLVGPTGGGKTTNYRVLQKAMTSIANRKHQTEDTQKYSRVRTHICNPKCITMNQLYGAYDEATHEWSDGILCVLFRRAAQDPSSSKQWVVFDGPVDALWIESMNTVLDENKKLCLVSGEIIQMSRYMTMFFEVEDLAVASPATVSRCGMIYMEPSDTTPTHDRVRSWTGHDTRIEDATGRLHEIFAGYGAKLTELVLTYVDDIILFSRINCTEYLPTVDNNLIDSCFRVMDGFMRPIIEAIKTGAVDKGDAEALTSTVLRPYFFLAIVWSIGATVTYGKRPVFSDYVLKKFSEHDPDLVAELPKEYEGDPCSVYDVFYEWNADAYGGKGWKHWLQTQEPTKIDCAKKFSDHAVATKDSVRGQFFLKQCILAKQHCLATGPTGTGKTLCIENLIMSGLPENFTGIFLTFSAQTNANQVQDTLMSKFDKRKNGLEVKTWGPPTGKQFVVLVDDTNMPLKQTYGAQPPIELLRQFLDHQGFYNYKPPIMYNEVVDLMLTCSMGPPGGGRQSLTNRFLRHFNHIAFDMDIKSMTSIFQLIMRTRMGPSPGQGFPEAVFALCDKMVESTIAVFQWAVKNFLPTPNHVHYTFNLRDVAKVFSLIYDVEPKVVKSPEQMIRLWIHECERVFRDRTICAEDRAMFDAEMDSCLKEKFAVDERSEIVKADCVIWGSFMNPDTREYDEIEDSSTFITTINQFLTDYNESASAERPAMPLVIFQQAAEHVARVARILMMPAGHALLLGVGGSGRRSLTRLAAAIPELEVFYLEITKSFSMGDWRDALRRLMSEAGLEDKGLVFLFTDTQIVQAQFMEDVAGLLNTADVANLFDGPELDNIYSVFRTICQADKLPTTKISMYARFVKQVRTNLHIVLAFSPIGEAFRTRMRQFPAILNCCTIDWYDPWPDDALMGVARDIFIRKGCKVALPTDEDPQAVEQSVFKTFTTMQQSATALTHQFFAEKRRQSYVTPSSYLGLLDAFQDLLEVKRQAIQQSKQRLVNGLTKLKETEDQVAGLRVSLEERQPVLVQTQTEVKELMEKIAVDKEAAAVDEEAARVETEAANAKRDVCKGIKDGAEAMLSEALPALDEAKKVLKNLKVRDLQEVGKYASPPAGVLLVMQAVLTIKGIGPNKVNKGGVKEDDWWGPSRDVLRDAGGLHEFMLGYEPEKMTTGLIKSLSKFIDDEKFSPPTVRSVSVPCAGMCQWVHAMYKYYHVNLEVEPKRRELEAAEAELQVVESSLAVTKRKLADVEARIAGLQAQYDGAIQKQDDLAAEVKQTEGRLDRAGRLIDGLSGEKARWIELVAKYDEDEKTILGDVIIASGYVAYLGIFTAEYREATANIWAKACNELSIPHSSKYFLPDTHGEPVQIQQWAVQGLPSDPLSIENAIITSKSSRWPLMIDPQGQANVWIRNMESMIAAEQGRPTPVVCKVTDPNYARQIEGAIRLGASCLLENIQEDLDPLLEPILLKQTFLAGSTTMIKVGENAVPWDDKFKLYMTTKLPNPHYTPETSVKVSILNFFITPGGLEDQLLSKVVGKERKDLEDQKNLLTKQNAAMLRELKDIQDTILRMLQESEGEVLDNEELIVTLEQSKVKSTEISKAVAEAKETEIVIDQTREKYRPVAFRGSILFFCVAALAAVDPMYQYSLSWYMNLFLSAVDKAEESDDLEERLQNLMSFFTYSFYGNVCRSLFEKHKLMFSFCLCCTIIRPEGKVNDHEYRFLLTGAMGSVTGMENPAPDWLTDAVWADIQYIDARLENYAGFAQHFVAHHAHYKGVFDSDRPQQEKCHPEWEPKMTPLMRLVFIRVLRADKMIPALQDFVCQYMEKKFIIAPTFDLDASFRDSDCSTPLIFILTTGADPMDELMKFASKQRMLNKMHSISLGQGQGPRAQALLEQGKERGTWVVLQNCHLATSWMPKLEQIVENFNPDSMKREFRAWLTSMPSKTFPVSVLQAGVKMTNEPPRGLRANLIRAYTGFTDEWLDNSKKPDVFKKLIFALCLFHAILQDRRLFGPLGFNIPYEFSDSDCKCTQNQMQKFIDMYEETPFPVLWFLTGQINYGGRVTDDWDRRCLLTMLDGFIAPQVLEVGYKFSPSGIFVTHEPTNRQGYLDILEELPINADPEAFGLHENGAITSARNTTFELLGTVLMMESGGGSGGGLSREEVLANTAAEIAARTPDVFNLRDFQAKYPVLYEDSMNTVLVQESVRYNKLLNVMARSLKDFQKALRGEVVMAADLEEMGNSMFNNQVPGKWAGAAYPSLKPLSGWVDDLVQRVAFIQNWYDGGHPPVFWLSGLYFPQGFLTGSKQNFARSQQVAIDRVSFATDPVKEGRNELKHPPQGVYVDGLFMEGARWDPGEWSIVESRPKELFTTMPVFWFNPVIDRAPPQGSFKCPLYKTLLRAGVLSTTGHSTNFVLPLEIPTSVPDSHWVKRGVGCFLALRT